MELSLTGSDVWPVTNFPPNLRFFRKAQGVTNAKTLARKEAKELAKPLFTNIKATWQEVKLNDMAAGNAQSQADADLRYTLKYSVVTWAQARLHAVKAALGALTCNEGSA
eukprot:6209254-Pleurochrysis_carterae.AAC.5